MMRSLFVVAWCSIGSTAAFAQGLTPEQAVRRMQVPAGFQVGITAAEPMIRQPVSISFDERGRLWVLQYLQYPNPNGLKAVRQDQYLRTVWDRIPEPPPRGPKGADRITILEDPDGNGRYRKAKDFLSDLNLASGFCLGNGGVYVVQPPYLLFYPDRNQDDVPDGPPEVLLSGFGMEDSHAYANSLQWGPDGWLYGAQGSTVTAKIRNPAKPNEPPIEFQQGIWRYHPKTKQFELFSEGGGNTWGLDFDEVGQILAGTNWGNYAMLHQVQGAYYVKGFAKHGPLHNPNTYGYFDHVPYRNFQGGHVTCGGIVYLGDTFPKEYRGLYIAGNLLSNVVNWHALSTHGSSFTAQHHSTAIDSKDPWFRPVDLLLGPDGSVYVVDWHDKRAAHLDPVDNWDRTNGRIYRLAYQGTKPISPFDLRTKSSAELLDLLKHPNVWWRREARRLLGERNRDDAVEPLRHWLRVEKGQLALESLWTLASMGRLDAATFETALRHENPHVRAWAIRLMGDFGPVHAPLLRDVLSREPSPIVRNQAACTLKRMPVAEMMTVLPTLLQYDDTADPMIPLLLWWAIEDKAIRGKTPLIALFQQPEIQNLPVVSQTLLERLVRRYAVEDDFEAVHALMRSAASAQRADEMLRGLMLAMEGRRLALVPPALRTWVSAQSARQELPIEQRMLLVRLGDETSVDQITQRLIHPATSDAQRIRLLDFAGQLGEPKWQQPIRELVFGKCSDAVRQAAIGALGRFLDEPLANLLLERYPTWSPTVQGRVIQTIIARPNTVVPLLHAIERGKFDKSILSIDQVRQIRRFDQPELVKLVEQLWGKVSDTAGEKQARISWLSLALSRGGNKGDAKIGKEIFVKNCAICHSLFGEGNKIGPDLTSADRKNRGYLLLHIVDPSAYVRPEYVAFNVTTQDGRFLTGLVTESTPQTVTLLNAQNQKIVLPRSQIEEMNASPTSLMPEKLLDSLTDEQVVHLFAYLQSDPPASGSPVKTNPDAKKASAAKLRIVMLSGSLEYKSDESLTDFKNYLEANYPIDCVILKRKSDNDLPGLEALENCDLIIVFTWRMTIDGVQLERVKTALTSGKPIIGIRTASHAFQKWLIFDKEVLGGDYRGHHGAGKVCEVKFTEAGKKHPILAGVQEFQSKGSLYKNPKLANDVEVLLTGSVPNHTEPIAWIRQYNGGRVFYTSLGYPDDFRDANFIRMLVNAIAWTTQRELPFKPVERQPK